jgi:hypothetical protein
MFLSKGCVRSDTIRASRELGPFGAGEVVHLGRAKRLDDQQAVYKPAAEVNKDDTFQLAPLEGSTTPEARASSSDVNAPTKPGAAYDPTLSRYYLMEEGLGPFTFLQLRKLRKQKRLAPDDLLRRDQDLRWFPASEVPGLFPSKE